MGSCDTIWSWVSGDEQVDDDDDDDASSSSRSDDDADPMELVDSSELQVVDLDWELAKQSSLAFQ